MYNNTISGTATDSIIVHVVLYCNYIIITSIFGCSARDSIIVHVVLYCNYIIITNDNIIQYKTTCTIILSLAQQLKKEVMII
jgi:hypothetical protein